MLVFFTVAPADQGESMSALVAKSLDIIDQSGLPYKVGPMGTTIEGEWDEVMAVVKRCHLQMGEAARRVSTFIKIDDRIGATGRLDGKIASVEAKLGRELDK
jgi:uncharacterized protein (TIGR00106 family)